MLMPLVKEMPRGPQGAALTERAVHFVSGRQLHGRRCVRLLPGSRGRGAARFEPPAPSPPVPRPCQVLFVVAVGVYGVVGVFGAAIFGAHTESNIMVRLRL
jgi:sodium-coupled neutral amino acid transporter 11